MLGLALGGLALGKSLVDGLSNRKKAKEQDRANQEAYGQRKANFNISEAARGARNVGIQNFLGQYQKSLAPGAPNYQIDPETLKALSTVRPYAEGKPADVSAGSGLDLMGGLLGTGYDLTKMAMLGKLSKDAGQDQSDAGPTGYDMTDPFSMQYDLRQPLKMPR